MLFSFVIGKHFSFTKQNSMLSEKSGKSKMGWKHNCRMIETYITSLHHFWETSNYDLDITLSEYKQKPLHLEDFVSFTVNESICFHTFPWLIIDCHLQLQVLLEFIYLLLLVIFMSAPLFQLLLHSLYSRVTWH